MAARYGNAADNGTGGGAASPAMTSNSASGGGASGSSNKPTTKPTRSPQAAANAALKEQERAQQQSLQLRRKYEDAIIETYEDEGTRQRAKIISQYDREIEDLRSYGLIAMDILMLAFFLSMVL